MFGDPNIVLDTWPALKTGLWNTVVDLGLLAAGHPIISFEVLSAASIAVLVRSGTHS